MSSAIFISAHPIWLDLHVDLQEVTPINYWLIESKLFCVLYKHILLTLWRSHCRWTVIKFRPELGGAYGLEVGGLYRAIPPMSRNLGLHDLIRKTAPFIIALYDKPRILRTYSNPESQGLNIYVGTNWISNKKNQQLEKPYHDVIWITILLKI